MRTRVVSDPVEARALWDMLSPLERPFDLWELRECFYRPLGYELHFIVAEDESGPVGLLPLQWNTGHGQHERYYEDDSEFLEFFGGGYPLDNRPYLARPDARISQALFAAIDRPARLQEIIVDDPASVSDNFVAIEPDYSLPLAPYADIYDYLSQTSSSVHAGKARREMRQLEAMGVDVIEDDMSDLDLLFSWSIARFGDESSFTWDVRRQAFRDMLALSAPWLGWRLVTYAVAGEKEATLLLMTYAGRMYEISSVNSYKIKTLGKVTRLWEIGRAISDGYEAYDALTGDYGWKSAWHFEPSARYDWIRE